MMRERNCGIGGGKLTPCCPETDITLLSVGEREVGKSNGIRVEVKVAVGE